MEHGKICKIFKKLGKGSFLFTKIDVCRSKWYFVNLFESEIKVISMNYCSKGSFK